MLDDSEFRFRCGRLCLDFTATLGGRYRGGVERLAVPSDLGRWFQLALSLAEVPPATDQDLEAARGLREAIYRLVHPATRDRPHRADIELVNAWASRPDFAPQLGADARSVTLRADSVAPAGLVAVARDAIHLVSGRWLDAVRECGRLDCSLLFVDLSRPGHRRWCDMNSCGNRMKARQYRTTHRSAATSGR